MSFETICLKKLLGGDAELIPDISIEYFSGKNQKIYKLIIEYYSENGTLPSAPTLKAVIDTKAPVAVRGGFIAMVDAIVGNTSDVSNDIIISSLKESFVLRGVDAQMEELIDAQREKDSGKVKGILSSLLEKISINNVTIGNFIDEINKDDHFTVVPSGLGEEFDEVIGGGYSGLTIITAKSGHGKSIMLQQAAIESYIAGKNVLYLSLELSGKVLGNRVKSYISGIPFGVINSDKLTVEERAHIQSSMDAVFTNKENVWRVSTSAIDTDELLNIIKVEKQLYNIDVVVIDYLALVSPSKYDRGEGWVTISNLVKKLHKYTMQENLVIITASQINEVKKGKDGTMPEITTRGSKELEFSATQMFYLEKVQSEDPEATPMTLFQIKNRLAKAVHSIVAGDFATMKIRDSGVRIN